MKRKRLLGVVCAAALTLVLAACVYEDGAGQGDVGQQQGQQQQQQQQAQNHFPTATATFTPGTFRSAPIGGAHGTPEQDAWQAYNGLGNMTWRRGPMVVEVDFSADQILDIRLVTHGESAYGAMYLYRAYPMVPDQILVQQSTADLRMTEGRGSAVNVFVGGTATQASIVNGVEDAIRQAGADPAALAAHPLPSRPLPGDRFVPGTHTVYVPAGYYYFDFNNQQFRRTADLPQWPTESVGSTGWSNPENPFFWEGAFTSSVNNGLSRVLFANPLFGRNPSAIHGATLAESQRPVSGAATPNFPDAVINNVAREMGFDPAGANPFYRGPGTPVGLWVTVNFGRNYFQLAEHANGDGLGTAGSGGAARPFSGESLAPSRDHATYGQAAPQLSGMNGSSSSQALGGYWWIQTAHRSVNDRQSTMHIQADTYTSATQSALGVRRGVEMAMLQAGATQAEINSFTPRAHGNSPFWREPNMDAGLNLIPGMYTVDIPGYNLQMVVTLCRSVIRYIAIIDPVTGAHMGHQYANAADRAATLEPIVGAFVLPEWALQDTRDNPGSTHAHQTEYGTSFRGRLLFAYAETFANGGRQASAFDGVEPMPSNPEFSAAVIQALVTLVETQSYNGAHSNINQAGRLGQEIVPSPFR
jgi:uncharacterized protein with FMN-binding domain